VSCRRAGCRTEPERTTLDEPIRALAVELRKEVADLLKRVRQQIDEPEVQPLGLAHKVSISDALELSTAVSLEVIRGKSAQKPDAAP
jgi:ABC-type molybdate transport system ATPase subunit